MNHGVIIESIAHYQEEMIRDLIDMCSIPAVNPAFGGSGEYERMQWLMRFLDERSLPYQIIEVSDERVKQQKRLNVLVRLEGSGTTDKTLWFVSHMDTVAAGDLGSWNTDPFHPVLKDGRIYGRGVEDNGQAAICSLYACLMLKEQGIKPNCRIGFAFVSDEESGSQFGLRAIMEKNIFSLQDEAVVPDGGRHDGSFMEIAEKSILWVRFTVIGKEAHASTPGAGINASSISSHFAVDLEDKLKMLFTDRDDLFNPPFSTFEITQKFANVGSPNVLPGKDLFVMDMRILPSFKIQDVVKEIDKLSAVYEYRYKVKISYEFLQRVDAPRPTPSESQVVTKLAQSLTEFGIQPVIGGIGGGTCAAILREIGIPAVVWSTVDELAHQPNEYAVVANLLQDTKVFVSTILKYT